MQGPPATPAPASPPHRQATLLDAYGFFLPLIFMAEMMMISHSIIHAFLARLPDPKLVLAAYNVAFSFHSVAGSPVWTAVVTSLAFITDRRSIVRLFHFNMWVALAVSAVTLLLSLTPLGDLLFGGLMGASAPVVRDAKAALVVFVLIAPVTVFRSISYALLMKNRYTILITIGTFLRLLSLAGYLVVLPWVLSGASVGAGALFLCIATESLLAVLLAHRFYLALPPEAGPLAGYRELWRFAWPLMLVQASENGVAFTINFFLGRLAKADLALAAFGVADGLGKLMLGPLRNLAQAAQTLVRNREELRTVTVFSAQVVAVFAAAVAFFYLPAARHWLLASVMGLTPEIADAIAPALLLFVPLAGAIGFSALARGVLMSARITGQIAQAAGWRLLVVVAVGSVSLWQRELNGAVLGLVALIGGFGVELVVLGWRVLRPAADTPLSPLPPALRRREDA
jgi:O-antigen/teichoic acid export membrane protein